MRLVKHRMALPALVASVLLTALGATLANSIIQVGRNIPSNLRLESAVVINGDLLGLWFDEAMTEPVTSLEYAGVKLHPPLESFVAGLPHIPVYIQNNSGIALTLIAPCGEIESSSGIKIGRIAADAYDTVTGSYLGNTCDNNVILASGDLIRAVVQLELESDLASVDYRFATVFGALGSTGDLAKEPARLAFATDGDRNFEIYVMDADGSNKTRLTNDPSTDTRPDWAPAGDKIVFQSSRAGGEIFVMDADGSNLRNLTNTGGADEAPSFSPDGTKIVFASNRDGGDYEIYSMNADGSNQTRLTYNSEHDHIPGWSPDGRRIAFEARRNGNVDIYVMDFDGSNVTRLTEDPADDRFPAWSPDGTEIVFTSKWDGQFEIHVMLADGSQKVRLTYESGECADWSADGKTIVFASDRGQQPEQHEIWVMRPDGSDQSRLTSNSFTDTYPVWSPGSTP